MNAKTCTACGAKHENIRALPLISYAGVRWSRSGEWAIEVRRCTCDQPIAQEVPVPWADDETGERRIDLHRAFAGVDHSGNDEEEE